MMDCVFEVQETFNSNVKTNNNIGIVTFNWYQWKYRQLYLNISK